MTPKIVALVGVIVGGITIILQLLNTFGVDITADQQKAIASVAGLVLTAVGVWFHPSLPGNKP